MAEEPYGKYYRDLHGHIHIDLDLLARNRRVNNLLGVPNVIDWLGKIMVMSESWVDFLAQIETPLKTVLVKCHGQDWILHPLAVLHVDLASQLGIFQGDIKGKNTPEFIAFHQRYSQEK